MQFDWMTFGLEILNFLVLVWLLKHFLYRPVLAVLDARQARVKSEMARAEELVKEGANLKNDYEKRLAQWTLEQEQLRQQLEQELVQQRAAGVERIRQSLADEETKMRARRTAEAATHEADLGRRIANVVYGNVAAMLRRLASPTLTESLVALLLEDLSTLSSEQLQNLREAAQKIGAGGTVEIESAHALTDASTMAIARGLSAVTRVSLQTAVRVNPELIAGIRIAVGECLLHADLADELTFFHRQDTNA